MYTDSHTHLYLDAFKDDNKPMIQRALEAGVTRMFLPNIDSHTIEAMFRLADQYPNHCFPMMALHPTSVKEDYLDQMSFIEQHLDDKRIVAIGESGIDLYWDTTFMKEQEVVFRTQIQWAKDRQLPLVIHARDSFHEIFRIMDDEGGEGLKGVFHSFTGSPEELKKALSYNFMIGINGIVTFKNSNLSQVVKELPLDRLLLETESPFLSPVPYRGKRNESSYLVEIAAKVAEIHNLEREKIGEITTHNSLNLFQIAS